MGILFKNPNPAGAKTWNSMVYARAGPRHRHRSRRVQRRTQVWYDVVICSASSTSQRRRIDMDIVVHHVTFVSNIRNNVATGLCIQLSTSLEMGSCVLGFGRRKSRGELCYAAGVRRDVAFVVTLAL